MKLCVRFVAVVAMVFGVSFVLGQPNPKSLPPVAEEKLPTPQEEKAVLSETIGLLATMQLYQTYLNIGLLADGKAEGVYSAETVSELLGSIIHPLDQVEQQLTKVSQLRLTKEDQETVKVFIKIVQLLRQQGKALVNFWNTGKEEDAKLYETSRTAAWRELSGLLKLEPQPKENPPRREVSAKD
jgi:hypothetical protein